jgi:hypothetical protein
MVPMQAIRLLTARLLAAQTPDEAFSLVVQLRSPATASNVDDSTRSESQRAVEHAYRLVGRREGTATVISMLLAQRFGPLTEAAKAQIEEMDIFQLQDVAERLLTVPTLGEALEVQSWPASAARAELAVFGPQWCHPAK